MAGPAPKLPAAQNTSAYVGDKLPEIEDDGFVSFTSPTIQDNPNGWGPCQLPEKYKDLPYRPFQKGTRILKAADWNYNEYQKRRYGHDSQDAAMGLEDGYNLVNTAKAQKQGRRRWGPNHRTRREVASLRDERSNAGTMQSLNSNRRTQQRMESQLKKKQQMWQSRRNWNNDRVQLKPREMSVDIKASWKILEEFEFTRLNKLNLQVSPASDIATYGQLQVYEKTYDRINAKTAKPLQPTSKTFHRVTTTDDPIIRDLIVKGEGTIFATDAIMSAIMACPRSRYSWDLVAERVGDKLFLDKRDDSDFDFLTASETATVPPQDEEGINSPAQLAFEASLLNQNFSQQCLKTGTSFKLQKPNPFAEQGEEVASVGYRYRKWEMDGNSVVARTEHDAVSKGSGDKALFMNVKTMNEFDLKKTNWRQKLDSQRGAVLATELKDNSYKLAKWTTSALLAGSDQLKLGYVTRYSSRDVNKHVILGTSVFRPTELASQISLKIENCWGIFNKICTNLLDRPEGKYLLIKDPNKQVVRLYSVPPGTFEDDDSGDDDDYESDSEEEEED